MNPEPDQTPGKNEEDKDAGKIFLYEGSTLRTREEVEADKKNATTDSESNSKFNTTVGDGVEREEGMANTEEGGLTDNSSSAETE